MKDGKDNKEWNNKLHFWFHEEITELPTTARPTPLLY